MVKIKQEYLFPTYKSYPIIPFLSLNPPHKPERTTKDRPATISTLPKPSLWTTHAPAKPQDLAATNPSPKLDQKRATTPAHRRGGKKKKNS